MHVHSGLAHECALRVDRHDPEVMSHILMVLSAEQLARMLGFWGSKATQFTEWLLTNNKSELKPSSLLKNTKSQEKAFYARKWDVPVPPQRALRSNPPFCFSFIFGLPP